MSHEVICPACGGMVEAEDLQQLVELAKEHTRDAHQYEIPEEHIIAAANEVVPDRSASQ